MSKFDYNKAVREDAQYFMKNVIYTWDTYADVDEWISEIKKSLEFRSYVCGMSDDSLYDYQGDMPVDITQITPSIGEVMEFASEMMDADELDETLKEYGVKAIDGWAREMCFGKYLRSEDFALTVRTQYEDWHKREFAKRRDVLIRMIGTNMCTPEEALDMYDTTLREFGMLK